MKEKSTFLGVTWTVRTELIGAVEAATSDACYTGNFVRSNLVINETVGTASFEVYRASIKRYDKFRSAIVRADKSLREQERAEVAHKIKYPNGEDPLVLVDDQTNDNIIPFHSVAVMEEEVLGELAEAGT